MNKLSIALSVLILGLGLNATNAIANSSENNQNNLMLSVEDDGSNSAPEQDDLDATSDNSVAPSSEQDIDEPSQGGLDDSETDLDTQS